MGQKGRNMKGRKGKEQQESAKIQQGGKINEKDIGVLECLYLYKYIFSIDCIV